MYLLRVDGGSGRRSLRNGCRFAFDDRWLRPAKLLDRIRDHLLGLGRRAKFWDAGRNYLLCYVAIRLPRQGGCNTN
jgi:hypothetical protein